MQDDVSLCSIPSRYVFPAIPSYTIQMQMNTFDIQCFVWQQNKWRKLMPARTNIGTQHIRNDVLLRSLSVQLFSSRVLMYDWVNRREIKTHTKMNSFSIKLPIMDTHFYRPMTSLSFQIAPIFTMINKIVMMIANRTGAKLSEKSKILLSSSFIQFECSSSFIINDFCSVLSLP